LLLVLDSTASQANPHASWAPSWTPSLYPLEPDALLAKDQLTDATLRQAVRLSIGGKRIRIVLSNTAGTLPLAISGVHVAMSGPAGTASILPLSDREVHFDGRRAVIVAAGDTAISDAVELPP
jgi:hypothetical protein